MFAVENNEGIVDEKILEEKAKIQPREFNRYYNYK
jgi:hypothetical protein